MPTCCLRRSIRIVWSTISNAALRSRRTKAAQLPESRPSFNNIFKNCQIKIKVYKWIFISKFLHWIKYQTSFFLWTNLYSVLHCASQKCLWESCYDISVRSFHPYFTSTTPVNESIFKWSRVIKSSGEVCSYIQARSIQYNGSLSGRSRPELQ